MPLNKLRGSHLIILGSPAKRVLEAATDVVEERRFRPLRRKRTEPCSQVVTRVLRPEGLLAWVTVTAWMCRETPWWLIG